MCVYISGSNSLHFTSPILHKVEAVHLTKSRESRECMQICEISGDTVHHLHLMQNWALQMKRARPGDVPTYRNPYKALLGSLDVPNGARSIHGYWRPCAHWCAVEDQHVTAHKISMAMASHSHPGLSERVRKLINAANARMEAGVAICTILHLPNIALQDACNMRASACCAECSSWVFPLSGTTQRR